MSNLISSEYIKQLEELHSTAPHFGTSLQTSLCNFIVKIMRQNPTSSYLDYGAGKRLIEKKYAPDDIDIISYDPAFEEIKSNNIPRDITFCIDVLEHIEPDLLEDVLLDLHRCTKKLGFYSICLVPAVKTLPDGRNAHLIVENKEWWEKRLSKYFSIEQVGETAEISYHVLVRPKNLKDQKNIT